MTELRWDAKDPEDVDAFFNDWSKRLLVNGVDTGDNIVLNTDPDPLKHPKAVVVSGDVVIDAVQITGKIQTIWVSGGTQQSVIKLTIRTTQGRRCVQRRTIKIKEN